MLAHEDIIIFGDFFMFKAEVNYDHDVNREELACLGVHYGVIEFNKLTRSEQEQMFKDQADAIYEIYRNSIER